MAGKAIGFTGTSEPITGKQLASLLELALTLKKEGYDSLHHGDCINADATAHEVFYLAGYKVIVHPPTDNKKRAFCKDKYATILPPLPYMDRNQKIVDQADIMIGMPKDMKEVLRSGTWATIRRARKKGSKIFIIWPDGTVSCENEGKKP